MPINVTAKQPYLRKLVCAYTGKPIEVKMVSFGGRDPVYFSWDAYDPGAFVSSSAELFRALGTRNGVEGAARNGKELVCPYTGAPMTVERREGLGFRAVGGFRPSEPQTDPALYARCVMSRGGVVPPGAPTCVSRVSASRSDGPAEEAERPKVSLDSALVEAEGILKDVLPRKTMVTVPAKGRSKK